MGVVVVVAVVEKLPEAAQT